MSTQAIVSADTLRTLHRIHQQLQDLRDRHQRGPLTIRAREAHLAKLKTELAELQTKARSTKALSDNKQLQLQSGEANVAKRRQQLREAKDNRGYQALTDQIKADEMANSVLADEALEAMERLDEVNRKAKEAEAAVAKAKEETQKSIVQIQQEAPRIQADLDRLQAELKRTEDGLPGEFRDIYQRLIRSKGSDGMAPLREQFCGGCNQQVTLNMVNALRLSQPVFCKSCGRLLYAPDDHSIASMPAAKG
jgi:predicted  nucleic acid-binding Zn-ribbon protein